MVANYLILARGKKLLEPVVFQWAVARNQAVARAFEEVLKCPVIIPEYPELAGAVGIALLTGDELDGHPTKFRGAAILDDLYQIKVWQCQDCENRCGITSLIDNGEVIANSGSRCGKHNC